MSQSPGKINPLLTTKLEIPSLSNIIVRRDRLYRRFENTARDGRITLVIAPAGFGKTTSLVEWLSTMPKTRQHTAWVTLDSFDNNPQQFWAYISEAIRGIYPHFSFNPTGGLPLDYDTRHLEEIIPLINAIALIPFRINLVLDDFHCIEHKYILQSMQYLMEHQPKNLHILIVSRIHPAFSFSRLRLQNRLVELTIRELSFTYDETMIFLTDIFGLSISHDQVKALQKATEGWIAGLQIAVLSIQNQPEFKYPGDRFSERNDQVFAYLAEEVLKHLKPDLQQFLLKTSVLPDLCAPLCDVILNRTDSQRMLQEVEQANLFLSSLDPYKCWYRYHPLFANALAHHLTQADPECIPAIHRCACDWLRLNGYTDKAVSHALAIGDLDTAAEIADNCALQAIKSFDMDSLIHWTNRFSLDLISKHPKLGIYRALACYQLTQLNQVEPELQRVEQALNRQNHDNQNDDLIRWEIDSIRAVMECTRGKIKDGIQNIQEIQCKRPESDSYFSGWLDHSLANVYHAIADLAPAMRLYEAGRHFAITHDMSVGYMVSTSAIINLSIRQGRLKQAEEECRRGIEFARGEKSISWLASLLYSYRMEIDLERTPPENNDERMAKLVAYINQMEIEHSSIEHQISLYLSMARCFLYNHNIQQAEIYLNLVRDRLKNGQGITLDSIIFNRFIADLIDIQAHIWTLNGSLATQDLPFRKKFTGGESSPLLYIAIETAFSRICLAREKYTEAINILDSIEVPIRQSKMNGRLIEILILNALSQAGNGYEQQAFASLEKAVELAAPEGYLRVFLDEGEPIRKLFEKYATQCQNRNTVYPTSARSQHLQKIINAFSGSRAIPLSDPHTEMHNAILTPTQETLTQREQDVYHLMLNGKSTKEIAATLTISVNTAKTHVWNIQRKLA